MNQGQLGQSLYDNKGIHARIVLDSVGPNGVRLTTFELKYNRFVHSELLTHRAFDRSSASSRAIPTKKMIDRILSDPALPVWWGKNQSGMQAEGELEGVALEQARKDWISARNSAVDWCRTLEADGLHKQVTNRVIEPWMHIVVNVTATDYDNWFALRDHKMAQPEIREVAAQMRYLYDKSTPQQIKSGEWHLPYVFQADWSEVAARDDVDIAGEYLVKVSTGRVARTSYLTHDGKRDLKEDVALHDRCLASGHMGPFGHTAMALSNDEWRAWAAELFGRYMLHRVPMGNLYGWKQYRKTINNEHNFAMLSSK